MIRRFLADAIMVAEHSSALRERSGCCYPLGRGFPLRFRFSRFIRLILRINGRDGNRRIALFKCPVVPGIRSDSLLLGNQPRNVISIPRGWKSPSITLLPPAFAFSPSIEFAQIRVNAA